MCIGKLKKNVLIKENVSFRLIFEKKINIIVLYECIVYIFENL